MHSVSLPGTTKRQAIHAARQIIVMLFELFKAKKSRRRMTHLKNGLVLCNYSNWVMRTKTRTNPWLHNICCHCYRINVTESIFYVRVFKRRLANAGDNGLNSYLLWKAFSIVDKTIFTEDHSNRIVLQPAPGKMNTYASIDSKNTKAAEAAFVFDADGFEIKRTDFIIN